MLNEKAFLQSVWRRAYAEPAGLSITYASKNDAIRMRLKLYRAVQEIRDRGNPLPDPSLCVAVENCEITIKEGLDERFILSIAKSMDNPILQQAITQLGMVDEPPPTPLPFDEDESLRRLQARLEGKDDES